MNSALQVYISLTDNLYKLCRSIDKDTFFSCLIELEILIKKIDEFRLFPFDVDLKTISALKKDCHRWKKNRNDLCRQLYVAMATLMYRFEASNLYNRAYFDYMLEFARTSLPYEVTNEWGKEYVQDMHFSHEGFFFAKNRDSRFLLKTKEEYYEYRKTLRKAPLPEKPIEKTISADLIKEIKSCYKKFYDDYCDNVEILYPEIKEVFRYYNMHLRIYLCSYDPFLDNPKIDFVLVNCYHSTQRKISIYPNYVDFAYRFCNIEEIKDELANSCLCAYKNGESIYNFVDKSLIYQEANALFVRNARIEILRDYVCYFLRGRCKSVRVLENGIVKSEGNTIVFYNEDVCLRKIKTSYKSIHSPHFMFVIYPSNSIVEFLTRNNIPWSNISDYGRDMINNNNADMVHWFIRANIQEIKKLQIDKGGDFLIQKLSQCACGKLYWHDYELIGTDIFRYLFSSDFQDFQFHNQSSTEDGILRRDLVVNNNFNNQTSIWGRMFLRYQANMIVVDFKNYSEAINSDCVFDVTKYMTNSVGNFIVVFSRKGLGNSGRKEQIRLFRERKLVLCVSDKDLQEMIQLKQSNKNPCLVMDRLLFEIEKSV